MDFVDIGFSSHYVVRMLDQEPARLVDYCFEFARLPSEGGLLSLESQPRDAHSRILEIMTGEGNVWIGKFEAGPGGLSGLFATPSPDTLIVVVQGQGYWIPILQPASYEVIASVPIKQILRVPERDIVLFVDFVRVEAYGPHGFLWQTKRLSWDGVKIIEVNPYSIRGLGWDAPEHRNVEFAIDTSTGIATGGSSPPSFFKLTPT